MNPWQPTRTECRNEYGTGVGGGQLGPTGLLDSFVNSLMISDMHLHAPPESGGCKGCLQTYLLLPLEAIKSDSTAVREVFYAVAEVEGGQTAAV